METFLELTIPGDIRLSERQEPASETKREGYTATDLLNCADDEITVEFGDAQSTVRPDAIARLELGRFHLANEETGRVFHSRLRVYLTLHEAKVLHSYLCLLIDHAPAYDPDDMTT